MKVFVLGTRGFPDIQGGIETHCEELYPRLADRGCDVTVITRTPYVAKARRSSKWNGVKLIHVWAPHQRYCESIIHTLLGVIIARLKSPHLVHFHAIGPSLFIPLARLSGMKVVMTHHGPDYLRRKWGWCAKCVLKVGEYVGVKNAARIVAVSEKIRQVLVQRYGRDDIMVIPNGVTISELSPETGVLQRYNLESQQYIVAVGRFVPEKGFHDLLQAYSRIANPEFKLVIVGDADHETDYSRMLKTMARTISGVVLTGRLPRRQLPELYAHAQLFVLPSSYEGLPLTLLEALSYNVPTLVSDIPAHREFRLGDYRYFPVGNIEVLSRKIIELRNRNITNDERVHRKEILERYDWERIADKTFSVYESLVEQQPGSGGRNSTRNTGC